MNHTSRKNQDALEKIVVGAAKMLEILSFLADRRK
jgi:hypothetical protein